METSTITTAVESIGTVFTTVIGWVTSNELLTVCFVGGTIVPIAIGVFRKLKRK